MKKKFLSITIVLSMLCAFLPVIASAYDGTKYGDYLYYEINQAGTAVTITGCDQSATEVVIPNEIADLPVTGIGDKAFYGCSGLTSVTIPNSVTSIGYYTFWNCSGLTSITLPNSVKTLAIYAFSDCSGLTSITIPDSVTSIGRSAFYNCSGLTSVTIGSGLTSIGEGAFKYCGSLDSVYISDLSAYLNIEFGNFEANPMCYADKLYINDKRVTGTVKIPADVTKIPYGAFDGCDGIKSVEIPDSVTSIGDQAFYGCSGLTSVTIGSGVTSIGNQAFYECTNLQDVHITDIAKWCEIVFGVTAPVYGVMEGSNPFYYATNLYVNDVLTTDLVIPDGVTTINTYAFSGCGGLTSVTIPDSVKNIKASFDGCNNLQDVYITDIAKWCEINFYGPYSNPFYYATNLYVNNVLTTDLVIPNGITSIGDYMFYGCDGLTSVTIPDSVTSIGDQAFDVCDGLTSVTIPDSVTTIGNHAFAHCSGLTDVTIGSGLESGDSDMFFICKNLTTVNYNASKVFSNMFNSRYNDINYNNILLIVLGDNVKSIDPDAFTDCTDLRRIIIPKSVTEIEKAAFKDCTSLTTVEYGGSKEDWEEIYIGTDNENLENANIIFNSPLSNTTPTDVDYLTYTVNEDNTVTITDCYENATSINIPKEIDGKPVTAINAGAFEGCSKLTSVTIPESVTSIGRRAFYGCSDLTDIVIPGGVTTIESSTFYGCSKLKNVTIPKSVTAIESSAFYGCSSLTDIVIPGGVTTIESSTFYGCSKLKNVTIPKSVTAIEASAFYGCDSLTDTYYSGTEADFGNIKIGYRNDALTNSHIYYDGVVPPPSPTPLPVTEAEITKAETDTAYTFTVTPETAYENCFVYTAIYDADGVLLGVDRVPLQMAGSTSLSMDKAENGATAKVFVWSDFMQSIIEHAEEFPLT